MEMIQFNKQKAIAGAIVAGGVYLVHRVLKAVYRKGYVKRPKRTKSNDTIH